MTRAGILLVGLVLLGGIFGPMLLPLDPVVQELPLRLAAPSLAHPFGLDELGRDILARLLAGARISLLVGLVVVSVSVVVGVTLGSIAGYFGGWRDRALRILRVLQYFGKRKPPRLPSRRGKDMKAEWPCKGCQWLKECRG